MSGEVTLGLSVQFLLLPALFPKCLFCSIAQPGWGGCGGGAYGGAEIGPELGSS